MINIEPYEIYALFLYFAHLVVETLSPKREREREKERRILKHETDETRLFFWTTLGRGFWSNRRVQHGAKHRNQVFRGGW